MMCFRGEKKKKTSQMFSCEIYKLLKIYIYGVKRYQHFKKHERKTNFHISRWESNTKSQLSDITNSQNDRFVLVLMSAVILL